MARRNLSENLVKIAAYSAELIRDDWYQSERLGQHPVIRKKEIIQSPVAAAQDHRSHRFPLCR